MTPGDMYVRELQIQESNIEMEFQIRAQYRSGAPLPAPSWLVRPGTHDSMGNKEIKTDQRTL